MPYVVNRSTRTIHEVDDKGRSLEQCNLDQARNLGHIRKADPRDLDSLQSTQGYSMCGHCLPAPAPRRRQANEYAPPSSPPSGFQSRETDALERSQPSEEPSEAASPKDNED